jgi:hypothetical protein
MRVVGEGSLDEFEVCEGGIFVTKILGGGVDGGDGGGREGGE